MVYNFLQKLNYAFDLKIFLFFYWQLFELNCKDIDIYCLPSF